MPVATLDCKIAFSGFPISSLFPCTLSLLWNYSPADSNSSPSKIPTSARLLRPSLDAVRVLCDCDHRFLPAPGTCGLVRKGESRTDADLNTQDRSARID